MLQLHDSRQAPAASAQPSIRDGADWSAAHGLPTIFERYQCMEPRCEFGKQGVCCRLCSLGPCRVNGMRSGVCGISADGIVARNLLQLATIGSSVYLRQAELALATLQEAARGAGVFTIREPERLARLARRLGIVLSEQDRPVAQAVAQKLHDDLHRDRHTSPTFLLASAPARQLKQWAQHGLLPGGAMVELCDALAKSASGIDSDPEDLLRTALRLGIATGFSGLLVTSTVNDIVLGTPRPAAAATDLGILDPTTVNIVAHGHDPYLATAVLGRLRDEAVQAEARKAGATGIKLYGSACVGQELLQRAAGTGRGVAGLVGNCMAQEMMIATGLVDLVMADLNCTYPGMALMAECFHTRIVPVSHLVRLEGIADCCDYVPANAAAQADKLIDWAIDAYRSRSDFGTYVSHEESALAGFCAVSLFDALGGSAEVLLKALDEGVLKGVVAVVGCTTVAGGHGARIVDIARRLIARDVLVIAAGCTSGALQVAGLMHPAAAWKAAPGLRGICEVLGIPPCLSFGACTDIGRIAETVIALADAAGREVRQLPIAVSVPEYCDQKAVCDGFFGVALGLLVHLSPSPPVGGPRVAEFLTRGVRELTGGRFLVENDPGRAVDAIVEHLDAH